MRQTGSPLRIIFRGNPVQVNHQRITKDMCVPNLREKHYRWCGDQPGLIAAALLSQARIKNALETPMGIMVDCHARDWNVRHDFMLIAFPSGENQSGVTRGWFDTGLLARKAGDNRADNDPAVVREALKVMAAELNAALQGK